MGVLRAIFAASLSGIDALSYGQAVTVPDRVDTEAQVYQDGGRYTACGIGIHAAVGLPSGVVPPHAIRAYDFSVSLARHPDVKVGIMVSATTTNYVAAQSGYKERSSKAPLGLAFGLDGHHAPIAVVQLAAGKTPGSFLGSIRDQEGFDVFGTLISETPLLVFFKMSEDGTDNPALRLTAQLKADDRAALKLCVDALTSAVAGK